MMSELKIADQESGSPLVSILIPTYNRADLIAETLDSALAQDYGNVEIVVTDNASTDATVEIVQQFADRDPRVKLFSQKTNLGPVLNWKAGLKYSKGKYIKILWSDDLMSPNFISEAIKLFKNESDLAFVFSKVQFGATLDSVQGVMYDCFPRTGIFEVADFVRGVYLGRSMPFSPGCAIFEAERLRNSLIETNDLFANNYLKNGAGPDVLMFLMSCHGVKNFGYIDEAISFFREHDNSITISTKGLGIQKGYAKALVWYLWTFYGKREAFIYWVYKVKKMRLDRIGKVKEMSDFHMLSGETKFWFVKFISLYFRALVLPSRIYLRCFSELEAPSASR